MLVWVAFEVSHKGGDPMLCFHAAVVVGSVSHQVDATKATLSWDASVDELRIVLEDGICRLHEYAARELIRLSKG